LINKIAIPIIFISGFLLSGCAGTLAQFFGTNSTPAAVATATEVPATPTPTINVDVTSLRGTGITFMYPWSGDVQIAAEAMVDEFNTSNEWGITVATDAPGSSSALAEAVSNDLLNYSPPEVIAAPIDYLLRLNLDEEVVNDLTPYVESPEYGLTDEDIQYFSDVFWQQDVVDGYRYGIPAQRTAKVMVYNQTWAEELGFTYPPATPEEFRQQVCEAAGQLKLDDTGYNDGLGGWIINYEDMTMANWLLTFGSNYEKPNGIAFNNNDTISALTYLRDLLDNDCAWLSTKAEPYQYFAERKALVYSADLQELFLQQRAQIMAGSSDEWTILPFPSESSTFILADGPSYAVLATSEKKKLAAWLFVRWLSAPDQQGRIVKAGATLPLGEESIQYAVELEDKLPQWNSAVDLLQYAQVPPSDPDWANARMILEDASWQLFKTEMTADKIPDLVQLMDQTLSEISVTAK
jgi:multiple sugar transport system substrate-binding protein/sn-glycerol 3-phosphate transport system substrate-binding protein